MRACVSKGGREGARVLGNGPRVLENDPRVLGNAPRVLGNGPRVLGNAKKYREGYVPHGFPIILLKKLERCDGVGGAAPVAAFLFRFVVTTACLSQPPPSHSHRKVNCDPPP